jgi:hypothetical protein
MREFQFFESIIEKDIYEVLPSHKSQTLGDKLQAQWKNQRLEKEPSMFRLLLKLFRKTVHDSRSHSINSNDNYVSLTKTCNIVPTNLRL